jgi:salicylate hydroxylase
MPFTVAVCGGGIGGLTLAIGLDRQGIDYHIYEAASAFAEIGAGVSFGPNSVRAMSLISPKIKAGYDRKATSNRDEHKANTWFDFQYGMGERAGRHIISVLSPPTGHRSVHRAHFLDELVSLVPNERATFGKKVERIDERDDGDGVDRGGHGWDQVEYSANGYREGSPCGESDLQREICVPGAYSDGEGGGAAGG